MFDEEKINLRSDEVQEILSRPPASIVRYGSLVVGVIVVIFILGSLLFRYPDIVSGEIIVTGQEPPVWLVARADGKIKEIYCSDRQQVICGQLLGVIENTAETKDVLLVEKWLNNYSNADSAIAILRQDGRQSLRLGEIQIAFNGFLSAITDYRIFCEQNEYELEKQIVLRQIESRKGYVSQIKDQLDSKTQELDLAKSELDRNSRLFELKAISQNDYEAIRKNYLRVKQELLQLKSSVKYQTVEIGDLSGVVFRAENNLIRQKNILTEKVITAKRALVAEIALWNQKYVFRASSSGIIAFNTVWKRNQNVKSGDKVFTLINNSSINHLTAKIRIKNQEYGKIKTNQKVNIKIEGYPYLQYGVVKGLIAQTPLIATEGYYLVDVSLPYGLNTTNGKEIPFNGEITGIADILTDNLSLFDRLLSPVLYHLTK